MRDETHFSTAGNQSFGRLGQIVHSIWSRQTLAAVFLSALAAAFLVLGGCLPGPLQGGRSSFGPPGGAHILVQGENAQAPTTQTVEEEVLREFSPGDTITQNESAGGERPRGEVLPAKTLLREAVTRKSTTTLGAAQKDTSRELAAKFANMKPVQFVGLALLLVAGALAYFKWWTPALIAGGGGLGLLVLAHSIVGNERLITIVLLIGLAIVITFRAYEKGQLDSVLPDALDKKKPPTP